MAYHFGPFKRLVAIHFPTRNVEWLDAVTQFIPVETTAPVGGTFSGIGIPMSPSLGYLTDKRATTGYDFHSAFADKIFDLTGLYANDGTYLTGGDATKFDAAGSLSPNSTVPASDFGVPAALKWDDLSGAYGESGEWDSQFATGSLNLSMFSSPFIAPADDYNFLYPTPQVDAPQQRPYDPAAEPVDCGDVPVSVGSVSYDGVSYSPVAYHTIDLFGGQGPRLFVLFRRDTPP